jgi:hypothetical protein
VDKIRLDWLEKTQYALISDDNGHWACVSDGMQNCPVDENTCDINTMFFIEKNRWHDTIRGAIDFAKGEDDE